ncbi:MAG: baseplate J/gp47 family protein [Ruminococcaceae bacterium]|nr:baseplate J/gp47 family protein [Oscillospiraceae bacterium]
MKSLEQIYEDMLEVFREETGYTMEDSADLAVRLRAAASEIFGLYVYANWIGKMAFPQTAEGQYLDYFARMRGLERKNSSKAEGVIRFYIDRAVSHDLTIPAGTRCSTQGLVGFVTTEKAVLTTGSLFVDVPAVAEQGGDVGNVKASTIVYMTVPPVGIAGCTNPESFLGGADGENDEQLRIRVLETYKRLPNGANAAYYENIALEDEGVRAVSVIPRYNGIGTVAVVVAAKQDSDVAEVLDRVQARMDIMREIAVDVLVMTPTEIAVPVTIQMAAAEGYDHDEVANRVRIALEDLFGSLTPGGTLMKRHIYELLSAAEGVANYDVLLPAEDISAADDEMIVSGTVTIERMDS